MNTNLKVFDFTRLVIKLESTAETNALTTRPSKYCSKMMIGIRDLELYHLQRNIKSCRVLITIFDRQLRLDRCDELYLLRPLVQFS